MKITDNAGHRNSLMIGIFLYGTVRGLRQPPYRGSEMSRRLSTVAWRAQAD